MHKTIDIYLQIGVIFYNKGEKYFMFKQIDIKTLDENIFKLIDNEWMLITAGNKEKSNMMTASWGFAGIMWNKPSVIAAVRPQRYTMEFIENNDYFTFSFYGDNKKIHAVCGKKSGRDINKEKECNLTKVVDENTGAIYFKEARLVFICKKQYVSSLNKEGFLNNNIPNEVYKENDYHNMIIGEIVDVLIKE